MTRADVPRLRKLPNSPGGLTATGLFCVAELRRPDRKDRVPFLVGTHFSYWPRALPDWMEQDDVPKVTGEIVS
jgi:hypothetical protein